MLSRFAVVLAFALPGTALAQDLNPQSLREVDDDQTEITYEGRSVDELEDTHVVAGTGQKIGEIEEVLANAEDEIVAVVVEYDDGFLDLGEREVVMPVDQLQFGQEGREVTTALTDTELKSLQVWDD
ncbi:PRC-barrel domain-containing protein [Rhodospirillaceae bacterium SYSU D60014]|uniref:PRC-barrel domain-containing protein n=1 Tax=Virgifigura deserti TaxID=2268457 RepID=UPI0013C487E5